MYYSRGDLHIDKIKNYLDRTDYNDFLALNSYTLRGLQLAQLLPVPLPSNLA
jgi:hypothetical protein